MNISHYKTVFDSADAHLQPLDPFWDLKLNSFQKLCFLRCFRADKVTAAVKLFIEEHLGAAFTEPPALDLVRAGALRSPPVPTLMEERLGAAFAEPRPALDPDRSHHSVLLECRAPGYSRMVSCKTL